ncbi:hypothetical protein POJ06DRAFT_202437 [Lipomyces tetrasporus]|uniref:Phosphatidate phosphatase APP1 catalytic domain-containing protein n=1 Tax=Lipomyces tetrasporus TaxID=54092 RepID=A0AAD7VQ47_9ASCO|nr:uncharacterized protein POJ06DRAFT_202437 [Lipomyces tetrasporus]KAJ8097496.1 hypothetical protein POJ06DRAFT_202437 [Lipomyces tetrasporus]
MSCLSPAAPRGLQAVIPIDPPPSKREKVKLYLQQKKEQFDQYQKLLNQQRQQLVKQRQKEFQDPRRRNSTTNPTRIYRLLSSTSFTSFARAQQTTQFADQSTFSRGAPLRTASNVDSESSFSSKAKLLNDKDGEKLVMFPSYARRLDSGLVEVDIRGWVFAPGLPNRKNRLFTSVVRQLVGVPSPADGPGSESAEQPLGSPYTSNAGMSSADNIHKNKSAVSVSSVLSSGMSSPSPSRRGSSVGYSNARFRSESPASTTTAMNIPEPASTRSLIRPDTRNSRSYSPSSPGHNSYAAVGTSPASFGRGASPRRDTYSAAQQARRLGVLPDDASGAVINNRNFVQPTLVGERQPLLAGQASKNNGYLINLDSESESEYNSESDDDEVVDNQQTFVVERRSSPARSFTATTPRPALNGATSTNDIRRQRSFYANRVNGSSLSIAGHNSEVVAANSDNAPLASSPGASSMTSYFPNYGNTGSGLNLHRAFSMSGGTKPRPASLKANSNGKGQRDAPPPLPPRPKLISFASIYNPEKSLQERIAPFISRPIAQEDVTIHVGSTETEEYSTYSVITTDSGHFGVRLRLAYEPAISCVECGDDLITVEEVNIIEPYGVGLISDIDDTVKHTGITGAKKGIFKNVFVKDYAELEIKGVADWYQRLSKMGVPVHYVSNSPWQLYPSIAKFLRKAGLPTGSVHLKHYNGFLYGLLEPAVERKRFNLESILIDFPYRKFILVGDSGEMDLEAYVNLACQFPDQVLAIYIRDVTTTCSDTDNLSSVSELNGFFTSSVPRPDEIDDLLTDNSGLCCTGCLGCLGCTGSDGDSKYYNRPHSPPPLLPKPQNLRSSKITTEPPEPTSTEWISTPSRASPEIVPHKAPKVPEKPSNLKSQFAPVAAPAPVRPGADFDLLSSSAGSAVSPLAARLAAFSSTFGDSSGSPEAPSYMSIETQQRQALMQEPPERIPTAGNTNASGNAEGLLSESSTKLANYNSISDAETKSPSRKAVSFSNEHHDRKQPLPPRPANIGRSGAVAGKGPRTSDAMSYAYRACIGMGDRSNRDGYPQDKKVEMWKKRVARARMMLPTGVRLRMWRIGEDVSDECEAIVQECLDGLKC